MLEKIFQMHYVAPLRKQVSYYTPTATCSYWPPLDSSVFHMSSRWPLWRGLTELIVFLSFRQTHQATPIRCTSLCPHIKRTHGQILWRRWSLKSSIDDLFWMKEQLNARAHVFEKSLSKQQTFFFHYPVKKERKKSFRILLTSLSSEF